MHNPELYEMCLSHFNEPMISSFEIVRCVGYGETAVDCYIIARKRGGKLAWLTCVGGYHFLDRLRGQGYIKSSEGEDWDDLVRLDSMLGYNGAPRELSFLLEIRHDDWEGLPPRKPLAS